MKIKSNRRGFLKLGTGAAGLALSLSGASRALAAACGLTPPQTDGPFYPGEDNFHQDGDLTVIPGHSQRAIGQIVYLSGKVVDQNCEPIAGANVEIWQACASGKYNNPRDPNPAPIDPHFKYWAEAFTDAEGSYRFKTILPGAYPASADWTRPPHIHFRITHLGHHELVTQMYFKGNQYNDRDRILLSIPESERDSVIVDFRPTDEEPGALAGTFDITLRAVGRT